jgi:hypothetical protein
VTRPRLAATLPAALVTALVLGAGAAPGSVASTASDGLQAVRYGGVEVRVPAGWPVVDLTRSRTGCVRLDRNAVYLGDPEISSCPAHLVGSAQAVQIAFVPAVPGARSHGRNAHGLAWARSGAQGTPGTLQVPGDRQHAAVTMNGADDDATTQAVLDSVRHVDTASAPVRLTPAAATATPSNYTTGGGFDACTAPSVATMQKWLASPYRTVGVYVGGINRACSQANLTASWVTQVSGLGWSFIPTYVGRQAPCWSRTGSKIDPAQASSQGTAAASDAVTQMSALGLGPGNPVYYDMEGYSLSNSSCVSAVATFMNSWTARLHVLGYTSGFYSSAGSGIQTMIDKSSDPTYHLPDDIWFAHWDGVNKVYGDAYVPDSMWANHHRIKQYRGGHNETWDGVTINIDSDAVDGSTAPSGAHRVPSDVNGDGRSDLCAFTGVNGYPSASGKLELHCLNGATRDSKPLIDAVTPYSNSRTRYRLPLALDVDGDGRTDACLVVGLNGETTDTGKVEVHCATAIRGFTKADRDAYTPWPYLNTHYAALLGLDVDADGRTDLCRFTGIDGHPSPSGTLELHCLSAASGYTASVLDANTLLGYANTWASLPMGLDVDGDGKTDACLVTGLNGNRTASGRLEVSCALGATGYVGAPWHATTSSAYVDTRYQYPVAMDSDGDGRTDLCLVSGLNGGTTNTGRLQLLCLDGAKGYAGTEMNVATGWGYLRTASSAFLADAPFNVDVTTPAVTPSRLPTVSLTAPLRFEYAGQDSQSGVASYDVRMAVASYYGGFTWKYPASWQGTSATSVTTQPVRGATYCFSARARDHLRNVSAWTPLQCTASPLDDRNLSASAGWLQASSPTYYLDTISRATSAGRTLTRTNVQTHRVHLVATTCPTCGTVGVYWNGTLIKTISLRSTTAVSRRVLGVTTFPGVASGTLVLRSLTSGPVYVDGLSLSRV